MPESRYKRFDVPSGSTAYNTSDPETVAFQVPEGEVWYVDSVGFTRKSGEGSGNVSQVIAGISASDPVPDSPINSLPRHGESGADGYGGEAAVGAYAYGGETVVIGIDGTEINVTGYLSARRIL